MKKLLATLGTITIAGSGTAGLVGNAPAPAKSEINYLETLNRVKRENNNKIENWFCFLCPRRLSIAISHNNWEKIRIEHNHRTRDSLYNFVYSLLKNEFENVNNLTNGDIEILSNIVCNKFNDIDNIFKYKNNDNIGLIIRTNRESHWSNSDNWWGVHLNKEVKNNNYNGNELDFSGTRGSINLFYLYFTFKPEFWEEVRFLYDKYKNNDDINSFADEFKEKCFNHKDSSIYYILYLEEQSVVEFGNRIWNNWDSIENLWQNSNKRNRIKLVGYFSGTSSNDIYSKEILDDENYRENKYLDNLENDFDHYTKSEINLGLIEDKNDIYILNKIKEKYPNLNINKLGVENISEYSNFTNNFSAKIKTNNNAYSHGILKPTFIFNTKTKIKELSDKIKNNHLVKQLLEHITDYNKNLPMKLENLKHLVDNQKWTAKSIEKEIIKGYIRDFYQIIKLIEHEWKLEELNNTVQGIKNNIDILKNEINELDQRVKNLENPSASWNCSNIAGISSSFIGLVPIVGDFVSAITDIVSSSCAIANT